MLIRKSPDLRYSDVTPKQAYSSRRRFVSGSLTLGAWTGAPAVGATTKLNVASKSPFSTTEEAPSRKWITDYNNCLEFGTCKDEPADNAQKLRTSPWKVKIE